MDLLDFDGEDMYFDQPLEPDTDLLLHRAAVSYGEDEAETCLLRAYFLQPEHLTVLVALYRYFYYRHSYAESLLIAERAIALTLRRLGFGTDWRGIDADTLGPAVLTSMTLTRFLLLAIKGAGYLSLRLGDALGALERFEKLATLDTNDRLGLTELLAMARERVREEQVRRAGGNVRMLRT
jgi:tetratricopeptide (TPR) repeat protein